MHITRRSTCRVCGSRALRPVIDLGEQHLQSVFVKPNDKASQRKLPTALVRCDPTQEENACGLLQMQYTVPPEILYSSYWYVSGTNTTMRQHLAQLVYQAKSFLGRAPRRVLDIGCNDGTLLRDYPPTTECVGVDPSNVARKIADSNILVVRDLFPTPALVGEFDIITSIAMFYDLEDPVRFARSVKKILAKDGLWCFEMSYMPTMLEMGSYDTICHEHLEYYSLAVIERILRMSEMRLIRIAMNSINGGSIRCYATHVENNYDVDGKDEIEAVRLKEFDLALETDEPYVLFQQRANVHKSQLRNLLLSIRQTGQKIHVYGASTKGNTLLQWCGIDTSLVEAAADRNPDKFGAHTLGTNIPIISEEESRARKPDYYLVLPWHFKKEFVERERSTLAAGTKMIFPLPNIEVVSA